MKIIRVLNNNAVLSEDGGNSVLVMGLSIGYRKKVGNDIDSKLIEKQFILTNPDSWTLIHRLLMNIPEEFLAFAGDMVQYAREKLSRALNDNLYISLTDHIYTAYERCRKGQRVENALLWDIKRIYSEEFAVARHIIGSANRRFNTSFTEDEAGFVAMHLINAQLDDQAPMVQEITRLIRDVQKLLSSRLDFEFNEEDFFYNRFLTHLRFFAQRALSAESFSGDESAGLLPLLAEKYPEAYSCALDVSNLVEEKYSYRSTDFDIMCITIHIATLLKRSGAALDKGGEA